MAQTLAWVPLCSPRGQRYLPPAADVFLASCSQKPGLCHNPQRPAGLPPGSERGDYCCLQTSVHTLLLWHGVTSPTAHTLPVCQAQTQGPVSMNTPAAFTAARWCSTQQPHSPGEPPLGRKHWCAQRHKNGTGVL